MEKNHPHYHQQPRDFFNLFSENYITSRGFQESSSSSSSSANAVVSTELSLSSAFSPGSSSTETRTKHTHQYFSNRMKKLPSKPNNKRSYYSPNPEKEKPIHESDISQSPCCSTTLKLYDDPWKIKKVLTASDLGKLNRLLLSSDSMEDFGVSVLGNNSILHHLHINNNEEEELSMKGRAVRVWDVETKSMHELILKRWASFKNYVLIGDWNQDFVKRRALKKGDEIGLQWDPYNFCFNFSVLVRAME